MLIEENGTTILTDPGTYTTEQNFIKEINVLLITHDHSDHLYVESLKIVLKNNPDVKIFTNKAVGKLLEKEGIKYELLEHGNKVEINDFVIEAFGEKHAVMHKDILQTDNTGYFINNRFFYPGDAFTSPNKAVEILALPVAGPWLSLSDAVEYAKTIHPNKCFPIHDGLLKNPGGSTRRIPKQLLTPLGIEFMDIENNKEMEF